MCHLSVKLLLVYQLQRLKILKSSSLLPESFGTSEDNLFMLEIMGDSMIEAGILNGDYVVVKQQQSANNGEIVVAMTEDDEATVKRFFKEKSYFRLQPENSSMEPIIVKSSFDFR